MIEEIEEIYSKFKHYDYIDSDFSKYRIKTPKEFDEFNGGVCWDFVVAIAKELNKYKTPWKCYFTILNKGGRTLATHTYIIVDDKYWVECSWQKHKGVFVVNSFRDIENLLLKKYVADDIHTIEYDPLETPGMSDEEFFNYLESYGKEVE